MVLFPRRQAPATPRNAHGIATASRRGRLAPPCRCGGFPLLLAALALAAAAPLAPAATSQEPGPQEPSPVDPPRLIPRHPDLSAASIAFAYEGDLWIVPRDGGLARRVTSHPGREDYPQFSPDGTRIAFYGGYDGGRDVYVLPASGGIPRRLTYHPSPDVPVAWTPDGGAVLFVSPRDRDWGLYRVPVGGGPVTRLPVGRCWHASPSPDGRRIVFNRNSSDRMNWRHYRGGAQQDVWLGDLETRQFERLTTWEGYDSAPMWAGNRILFASDREGDRLALWSHDLETGREQRLTDHPGWDVEHPSLGPGGVVYVCGGSLWILDLATNTSRRIDVSIPTDAWQARPFWMDPAKALMDLAVTTPGTHALAEVRGDIDLIALDGSGAVNLTGTPGSREILPRSSPDGSRLAFFSDRSGEYELYVADVAEGAPWQALTKASRTWYYHPVWSPDGTKILFGDKDYVLRVAEVDTGEITVIDQGLYQKDNELYWELSEYAWSPDSKAIAYTKVDPNMNASIWVWDLATRTRHRITDDRFDDFSPAFGPDGKTLYFLSQRHFEPELDSFMDNVALVDQTVVLAVTLHAADSPPGVDPPRIPPESRGGQARETGGEEAGDETPSIDFDGVEDRLWPMPIEAGTYKDLRQAGGKLFFLSRPSYGFPTVEEFFAPRSNRSWTLESFDLKSKSRQKILEGIGSYSVSGDGEKASYLAGPEAGVVATSDESKVGAGALDWHGLRHRVDPRAEFHQIWGELRRIVRDFFYDPDLHGRDWNDVIARFDPFLDSITRRADLNTLIGWAVAELGVSHEYIVNRGGPNRLSAPAGVGTGLLGADLEVEGTHWRFAHVLHGASWRRDLQSPLRTPPSMVQDGEYLLAVDGVPLDASENVFARLVDRAGKEVSLLVGPTPNPSDARTVVLRCLRSEAALRHHEWVEKNYETVSRQTAGRVGYFHLSDMDEEGMKEFEQGFRAERFRDGLIIDVRGNGGGFVSWFLLDKLERRALFLTQTRRFRPMAYPHGVVRGPIVVLCDQGTGSDGEVFTEHVKEAGLATVVGTPTWGGLIGIINMIPFVDGGLVTQVNVGFANLRGEWIVENRGALPHIDVENDPASEVEGRDPQLAKGIEVISELLDKRGSLELEPPPFPRR